METVVKHFTATAMIRNENGEFLLHKHSKLGFWLPPGGHVELNEEPQDAVIREVLEETGLKCYVVNCAYPLNACINNTGHTQALPMPLAILKELIEDKVKGNHWHIDMIYLCELIAPNEKPHEEFHWIPFEQLTNLNIPQDVIELAYMVNAFYSK
ncbi:NUDIX domain-containing protein [Providencia rustigianii]|uniref:NUDIX hydrolase n=1 Tax=Providencia rustigianii TaxID=158850 RepID=UPI000F6FC055|nr:NUDIX domain-containing protein [Providencia rustigianii]MTC60447.1 NUDIX domain-containing protein [Providencia rustigianii]VEH55117.1 nucleoside triphosphatase YtkD [Providencia rustigianii]